MLLKQCLRTGKTAHSLKKSGNSRYVHSLTHIHRSEGEPDWEKRLYSGQRPGDGHICSSGHLFPDLSDVCDEGRCDHRQHPDCCIRGWRTRGVEHVNAAGQVSSTQHPFIYEEFLVKISGWDSPEGDLLPVLLLDSNNKSQAAIIVLKV